MAKSFNLGKRGKRREMLADLFEPTSLAVVVPVLKTSVLPGKNLRGKKYSTKPISGVQKNSDHPTKVWPVVLKDSQ